MSVVEFLGVLFFVVMCLSALFLIGLGIKHIYKQIRLSFTKPWEDSTKDIFKVEFILSDEFEHFVSTYYKIDDVWWKQEETCYIDHSWDECKISEPISTLLTLIWEDYDNFTFETWLGGKLVNLKHNKLSISGSNDSTLSMFGHTIRATCAESRYIWHFVQGIKNHRDSIIKENERIRLNELREIGTDKVVKEINKYLEEK